MPSEVHRTLSRLYTTLKGCADAGVPYPSSIRVPTDEVVSAAHTIPLAAILLEYPVAYIPQSAPQTTFLSGVDLEVYSCTLIFNTPGIVLPARHTFMQFSCPQSILPEVGDLAGKLNEKFTERVSQAGLPCTLEVTSRTKRLDRVAL